MNSTAYPSQEASLATQVYPTTTESSTILLTCIVLLGCPVDDDGTVGPVLAARVATAAARYHEIVAAGGAALVVPTGGAAKNKHTEAVAMQRMLIEDFAVDVADVLLEPHATNTTTNAKFVVRLLRRDSRVQRASRLRIELVTSRFHVPRGGLLLAAALQTPAAASLFARLEYDSQPDDAGRDALLLPAHRKAAGLNSFAPITDVHAAPNVGMSDDQVAFEAPRELKGCGDLVPKMLQWVGDDINSPLLLPRVPPNNASSAFAAMTSARPSTPLVIRRAA